MRAGLLALAIFLFIIGAVLGSTFEEHTGSDWAGHTGETTIEYIFDFKNAVYRQSATGEWTFVMFNTDYFKTWMRVLTFDFTFFDGELEIVRWLLFIPLAIPIIWSIGYAAFQLLQGFIPFT